MVTIKYKIRQILRRPLRGQHRILIWFLIVPRYFLSFLK